MSKITGQSNQKGKLRKKAFKIAFGGISFEKISIFFSSVWVPRGIIKQGVYTCRISGVKRSHSSELSYIIGNHCRQNYK